MNAPASNSPAQTQFSDIAEQIWDMKYRYKSGEGDVIDQTVEDTWKRVATAVASREQDPEKWGAEFYNLLSNFKFLPGGRILANAGTTRDQTTMFNCYVMGTIPDSIDGIFRIVQESALTQKQGGGVGFDFSTIRPKGDYIKGVDSQASGPISFMKVLDATCRTIMSAGQRRGAQMAVLRCDHPDVEEFIAAKQGTGELQMFNLSVAVTDAFMKALDENGDWDLTFDGKVYKTIKAKELWDKITKSTYNYAEPGVIFIDRINEMNNLHYCENICATNPCGEQPLPPYGACLLGSINLTRFVHDPFQDTCEVDFEGLAAAARTAVRFLDNVIELSRYPLEEQQVEAHAKRRMGLGITGLANMLMFMRLRYGSREALGLADSVMKTITHAAYEASSDLAAEKGAFPRFDSRKYLQGKFIKTLPKAIRTKIRTQGIRNSHVISIAPTGTISLYAGNVSSGLEPVFALHYTRRIRKGDENDVTEAEVRDYAYDRYVEAFDAPASDDDLPPYFVTSDSISPKEHVLTQATLQKYVDSSISKTINVPESYPFDQFQSVYTHSYRNGLKGCTTFRPNQHITGVLVKKEEKPAKKGAAAEGEVMIPRPGVLQGVTYKIKTPLASDALYITINDIIEDGHRRPYELFINTKNLQNLSWIVAMTRLISAVFRRERDPSFLVDELKSIFDPNGGYYQRGKYVPSLAADIGRVIEEHLTTIGLINKDRTPTEEVDAEEEPAEKQPAADKQQPTGKELKQTGKFKICPQCHELSLIYEEGCLKCKSCLYSKCG